MQTEGMVPPCLRAVDRENSLQATGQMASLREEAIPAGYRAAGVVLKFTTKDT